MDNTQSFEGAYQRLEEILESLNKTQVSLEDSLKLYEEGDRLIQLCYGKLSHAEKKVQTLIKNREQQLILDQNAKPSLEDFQGSRSSYLNKSPS